MYDKLLSSTVVFEWNAIDPLAVSAVVVMSNTLVNALKDVSVKYHCFCDKYALVNVPVILS